MQDTKRDAMYFKARKVINTQDAVADFEISNFGAACAYIDRISQGKASFREASGPPMTIDNFQFDVCIVWGLDSNGHPDREQELGVYIRRMDSSDALSVINFEIVILNRNPREHRKLQDTMFRSLTRKQSRGWSPSFHDPCGIPGVTLAKVLDESNGWLHDGALRVRCRLSVVTGSSQEEPKPAGNSDSQQALGKSFKNLLESGEFSDVVLKVGDETIHAHTPVLACRSSVFQRMFSSDMRESRERRVVIEDADPDAMKELVHFFYTGDLNPEPLRQDETAVALLKAAHCYDAPAVVEKCIVEIQSRLTPLNVSEHLVLADMIDCPSFKEQCLDFMRHHIHDVQATKSYENLTKKRPSLLRDIITAMAGPGPSQPSAKKQKFGLGSDRFASRPEL